MNMGEFFGDDHETYRMFCELSKRSHETPEDMAYYNKMYGHFPDDERDYLEETFALMYDNADYFIKDGKAGMTTRICRQPSLFCESVEECVKDLHDSVVNKSAQKAIHEMLTRGTKRIE